MKKLPSIIFVFAFCMAGAQDIKTTDFFDKVKSYDFSDLWTLEQFQIENGATVVERSEPLGYIGEDYQRFYIHFVSAIQNPNNRLQYFVYGKTRVKENICSFQGTVTITIARTYDKGDVPTLKQGFIKGQYEFYEDPKQQGTGVLKGNFQTDFYLDEKGKVKYDALSFVADGFQNNQFEGTWTSYKTGVVKKCHWGDYRIPDSDELDGGAGEFYPIEKFEQNGWRNYQLAWGYSPDRPGVEEARKKEKEKWWR